MRSIDSKMGLLRIINMLNANSNVGTVSIELYNSNKWNSEIITMIANRYTNSYYIHVVDWNN